MLATDSIRNTRGGIVTGRDISATAVTGDIINERTVTTFNQEGEGYQLRNDVTSEASRFEATDTLKLNAGRDVINVGSHLKAGGNASVTAGRDVVIASQTEQDDYAYQRRRVKGTDQTTLQHTSAVDVGGNLAIDARRDIAVIASTVSAAKDLSAKAGESLTLSAAANEEHEYSKGKKGDTKTTTQLDKVTQQSAELKAGGDLIAIAGTDLTLIASKISAGNEAYVHADNELQLLAAQDSNYSLYDMNKKGGWGSKKTQRDEATDVKNVGSEIKTGGDLTLESGGDQKYQAAKLDSGGDIAIVSGGAVTFEAVMDLRQESHEKSNDNAFWVSSKGKGNTDETLRQTQMVAEGNIAIKAVEGLKIDVKQVNQQTVSQSIDAMVKADPQLAWIKEAEARGDVDWRQVKEIHDSFKYNNSGLGPASQIIIAIVMAAVVGPLAAGLTGGTVTGAALGAVASGAATNATVSVINNRGNLGAVLKDVTSSDAMKGYVISGVTAGLTAAYFGDWTGTQVNSTTGKITTPGLLNTWGGVGKFAANQTLQSGTSMLLSKALGQGGSASDALKSALFNTLAAASFNLVGNYTENVIADGSAPKIAIHAMVGGLLAEATGGDFKTGALAAGANEALVTHLNALVKGNEELLTMSSQIVGVLAAAGQKDADAAKLEKGAWVAQNATQYNYLNHQENQERWDAKKECQGGDKAACGRADALDNLDKLRDLELKAACTSNGAGSTCGALRQKAEEAARSLVVARFGPEAKEQAKEVAQNKELAAYSIESELRSIKETNNPFAAAQTARLAKGLAEFGSDFIPVYGDIKAFSEAKDPFDYAMASIGVIPGFGDAAQKVLGKAKKLYLEGKVAESADLVEGLSRQLSASGGKKVSGGITTISDDMRANPYHADWQKYVGGEPRGVGADVVKGGVDLKGNSVAEALTSVTQKQLDKKFKHASDFGVVTTKKNPETLALYESAIKTHMGSTSTTQKGTYGFVKDSKVFFNSTTNNAVVLDASGNFVTGFKLAPGTQQFDNFIKNGVLR
ncbi:hypothetical protein BFW87_27200 [Pseudomonas fluorescens]|uniref:DUF637 domain-containing protein n=1 Tax=Pseudomonas fluorescens TaxID=294 RepID=A0A1T2Y0W9_PSEFL|nr:hypothetical protein BFW87_27200 [Pseudomonas fluorescens]